MELQFIESCAVILRDLYQQHAHVAGFGPDVVDFMCRDIQDGLDELFGNPWTLIQSRVATGREGNIYRGMDDQGQHLAIKVYMCRPDCIGQRFDFNPRGLFYMPDRPEAEFSYLLKMKDAGVRCPSPLGVCNNILVLEFIGTNGVPAPTLSDAPIPLDHFYLCYKELIKIMRTLYHKCQFVHGDLSETNVLFHEGDLYVIDVSQGVDVDNEYASKLLEKDCARVLNFFRRHCVAVMTTSQLLDFIRDPCISDESVDAYIEMIESSETGGSGASVREKL